MLTYKNYLGKVEFDDETGILAGEVVNMRASAGGAEDN